MTHTHTHSQQMLNTHREMCLVILWLFCHEELQRGNKQEQGLRILMQTSLFFHPFTCISVRFPWVAFLVSCGMLPSHVSPEGSAPARPVSLSVSLAQHLRLFTKAQSSQHASVCLVFFTVSFS